MLTKRSFVKLPFKFRQRFHVPREYYSAVMDSVDESKEQKSKRIVRSLDHTAEEKRKQKKEWKKRKHEAKRAMSETSVKIANGRTVMARDQEKLTASVSQKPTCSSPQNRNQMYTSIFL